MPKFPKVNEIITEKKPPTKKADSSQASKAPREAKHGERQYDLYEEKDGEMVGVDLQAEGPVPVSLRCQSCGQSWRSDELSGDLSDGLKKCPRCLLFEQMDANCVGGEMRYIKRGAFGEIVYEDEKHVEERS
jgi:phage FluMu protein Com